jgi:hypothetical protein
MPRTWNPILVPSSEKWNVNAGAARGGGRGVTNTEQVVALPSGYATASLTVPCFTRKTNLAMRALLAGLDGRAGTVLIGPYEVSRAPWNIDLVGGKITYGRAAKRPDVYVGDQSATLDFRLSGSAAMNATSITIQRNRGGVLEPGMIFSIDNRLHMIVDLLSGEAAAPGVQGPPGAVFVAIRPWLRADYADGTPIEFGRPLGTMRLATDDTGAMEQQLSKFSTVTLDLVEAF